MPAKAATQIQVNRLVICLNRSLSITSFGWPTSANSRTNGLPISTLTSATRKIPALLSGCIHRSKNDWLTVNVSTASIKNVPTAPISRVRPAAPLTRPITNDSHSDRQSNQHGGGERDVADQDPIDDPRREAKENSHEGSV